MLLRGRDDRDSASAARNVRVKTTLERKIKKKVKSSVEMHGIQQKPTEEGARTSQGIIVAPSIGSPTEVFTANPTLSPACITATFGFDQAVEALRPQRRSSEAGSTTGMM